ncbi:methyltransferase family protein [Candidatus Omnitrophota bacterium]
MDIQERLKRCSKLRFAVLYPFGVFMMIVATPDDNSLRIGAPFIGIGLLIRVWANGYAVKLEKLTTSGPYALLRHPLYLGTMLIAIGFVIMLKIYVSGALFIVLMASIYYRTIKKEELMLEERFKEAYSDYKKRVPALFPRILPYRQGEKWRFSLRRLNKSKEYKLFLWMIILAIAFHLKHELMIERESMDAKIWTLMIIAFILGMIDLFSELLKEKNKLRNP